MLHIALYFNVYICVLIKNKLPVKNMILLIRLKITTVAGKLFNKINAEGKLKSHVMFDSIRQCCRLKWTSSS